MSLVGKKVRFLDKDGVNAYNGIVLDKYRGNFNRDFYLIESNDIIHSVECGMITKVKNEIK